MNGSTVTAIRTVAGRRLARLVHDRCADPGLAHDVEVVAQILPFKVSAHVVDHLVDWDNAPDDPLYRLVFPHRDMIDPVHFRAVERALGDPVALRAAVAAARRDLNPHPGEQLTRNIPHDEDGEVEGVQHKYAQTALVFPRHGQTCHAYCSYCFRWAQFVGDPKLRIADDGPERMAGYLRRHREVSDVLFTGGDPLVMRAELLERYVDAVLRPGLEHVTTVRIGTKALSFHPARLVTDPDAGPLLKLVERLVGAGRHVAVMVHVSHPRELEPDLSRRAVAALRSAGCELRSQAPVVRHVNDDAQVWADSWRAQVALGIHPYYLFVERDTGARRYFGLPIQRAYEIHRGAVSRLSGLGRTARGPVMSTAEGKVTVDGVAELPGGKRAFALRYLQARDPELVGRPFHARWDPAAQWWSELVPLGGHDRLFFPRGAALAQGGPR
ncbi:KamA family radical SAM protein [Streptomyces sp. CBMA152]|uniref:KamA family radical SAM protein n=1 Tax=Streptomyces sp. CBMA152 TaxID=1896312 RepID=UPI001660ADB3|nr:radical SAM protein [Streptomyces sp. CBMA152]MBD0742202.1 lysine 2,3-aminomutase [Streptomyces sp. CBMA152]